MIFRGKNVSPVVQSSSPVQWIETPAGNWFSQRQHLESTFILHLLRFIGVGRVSEPALIKTESWPTRRPCRICFQTQFFPSSSVTSKNFLWTESWLSLSFHVLTVSLEQLLTLVVYGTMVDGGYWGLAFSRSFEAVLGMHWLLVK